MASFLLHQTCENYYYATRLTFTLRNSKQHNLSKLISSVKRHSEDLTNVLPQNTPEEKRLFKLLKAAYVEARYNPHFVVTKEDIDALIPKVEWLREILPNKFVKQELNGIASKSKDAIPYSYSLGNKGGVSKPHFDSAMQY